MNVSGGLARLIKKHNGVLTGTSEKDWVDAMKRNPVAISAMPGSQRLLQWRSGRYEIQSIAVLFGPDHRFVKITHRYQC